MKPIPILLIILIVATCTNILAQDAKEISKKALNVTDIEAMEMTSTLKIYDAKGRERIRQTSTASKKFDETTMIISKFIAPADVKGTGLLIYDHPDKADEMWIYLPALRKVRRIVSSEKGQRFMGSEFTNADMSKPNPDEFSYALLGTDDYEGKPCWKVAAEPVNEVLAYESGFSKKVAWIDKNNFFTYKILYYDLDNVLCKEMIISDYEGLGDGKFMARKMVVNNLSNGRKSVLTIDRLQEGSALTEAYFTPAMLEK